MIDPMIDPKIDPMIDVLLCDDHVVVLAGLERLVSTFEGIRVVATATDGIAALAAAHHHRPQVILMDLQMPNMDGVEATRRITAEVAGAHVVILTSFSDRLRIRQALGAGAIGYQLKDATPHEIEAAIRAAARGEAPLGSKVAMTLVRDEVAPTPTLSPREMQTLELVASGLPSKHIARQLGIAEATVKVHLTSIYRTIGVDNRTQAARWYERNIRDTP